MDPYRAPREPEPPPVDAMRTVLFVAGGIAALIVIAAVIVSVADARRGAMAGASAQVKPVPTPTVADSQARTGSETGKAVAAVAPASNSAPLARPAPPRKPVPADGPLAFEAQTTPCFGDCDSHTTSIDVDGTVTVSRDYRPCPVAPGFRVSAAERAALASEARALHLDREYTSYVFMTDVQKLIARIRAGSNEWGVAYLPSSNHYGPKLSATDQRAVAAAAAFHDHIERAASTTRWLSACGEKTSRR